MTANPDFVDNRGGNTLQKAIVDQLKSIRTAKSPADELWIATAYFNPGGLELLAKETGHVDSIRLLLGAEPTPESSFTRRRPGDPEPVRLEHVAVAVPPPLGPSARRRHQEAQARGECPRWFGSRQSYPHVLPPRPSFRVRAARRRVATRRTPATLTWPQSPARPSAPSRRSTALRSRRSG